MPYHSTLLLCICLSYSSSLMDAFNAQFLSFKHFALILNGFFTFHSNYKAVMKSEGNLMVKSTFLFHFRCVKLKERIRCSFSTIRIHLLIFILLQGKNHKTVQNWTFALQFVNSLFVHRNLPLASIQIEDAFIFISLSVWMFVGCQWKISDKFYTSVDSLS